MSCPLLLKIEMKIFHIITNLRVGGAEVALLNRLKAMRHDADHLVVCFYDGPIAASIRQLGIPVVHVRGLIKGYDPVGMWQLLRIARQFKPDVIHTALWAANMAGRFVGTVLHLPVINELHGNVVHEGWLRNIIERWSLRGAGRIVAVSPSVRKTYEKQIVQSLSRAKQKIIGERLSTIANGIDRQDLVARVAREPLLRDMLGLVAEDFVVGAIGRFEKIKSYDVLIKSFARFCDLVLQNNQLVSRPKLLLIGDGSQRFYLEQLVCDLGLQKQVIFTGYRKDAYKFYPLFDCFALSSQSEGLSIALLEALALGVPVITSNIGLEHDAVVPGKNGLLIPVNDVEAYADGLLALYKGCLIKSKCMKPLAPYPFSIENVADAYRGLYQKLVHEK